MTNWRNTVLYVGVTNNLYRRVAEHQTGLGGQFTAKYKIQKLVYYETFGTAREAIEREKQLKGGSRRRKEVLIQSVNPEWNAIKLTQN